MQRGNRKSLLCVFLCTPAFYKQIHFLSGHHEFSASLICWYSHFDFLPCPTHFHFCVILFISFNDSLATQAIPYFVITLFGMCQLIFLGCRTELANIGVNFFLNSWWGESDSCILSPSYRFAGSKQKPSYVSHWSQNSAQNNSSLCSIKMDLREESRTICPDWDGNLYAQG